MPIYEYECTSCHHHFDLMQKINAEPVTQCPVCFDNSVIKLVSAAGFQLKGTGWYATDFKNQGTKSKETSENKTENKTENKEGTSKATDTVANKDTATKDNTPATSTKKSTKGETE
jgi:putative FmdB family regulatory protein